jgi:membrane fusion protein (multidrug efflux system)
MAVEVDVRNSNRLLKPGMFARVTIMVSERSNAITVPTRAILGDDKGNYVFVAVNNVAKRFPVQVGAEQDSRTEILKGLTGDENVITTGQQFVKDGGAITIEPG